MVLPLAAAGNVAGQLAARRAQAGLAKQVQAAKNQAADQAQQLANKALQRQLDIWKMVLLANFFLIFPLIILLVMVNVEFLLPFFYPAWKIPLWRRFTYLVVDLTALSIIVIVFGTLGYIRENPNEACQAMGGVWSVLGKIGGCSLAKEMFDSLLNL